MTEMRTKTKTLFLGALFDDGQAFFEGLYPTAAARGAAVGAELEKHVEDGAAYQDFLGEDDDPDNALRELLEAAEGAGSIDLYLSEFEVPAMPDRLDLVSIDYGAAGVLGYALPADNKRTLAQILAPVALGRDVPDTPEGSAAVLESLAGVTVSLTRVVLHEEGFYGPEGGSAS